jgi:hypothetical protein
MNTSGKTKNNLMGCPSLLFNTKQNVGETATWPDGLFPWQ